MNTKCEVFRWEDESSVSFINCDRNILIKRWHYHKEFELHYFRDFSGNSFVGDYVGSIQPGTLFLLAPKIPHSWIGEAGDNSSVENPSDFFILFSEVMISKAHQLFPELDGLDSMLKDSEFGIEFTDCPDVSEIGKLILSAKDTEGCARLGLFFKIIDKLMKCEYKRLATSRFILKKPNTTSEALNRALEYIDNHFNEIITLEFISELANMSESHFCRAFKNFFGIGFLDYVNKLRIERACLLLSKTDKAISSIGYECGFRNISNFNRNFKKYMRKPPSEFRAVCNKPRVNRSEP